MEEEAGPLVASIEGLRAEIDGLRRTIGQSRRQLTTLLEAVTAIQDRLAPVPAASLPQPPVPMSAAGFPILPRAWQVHFGPIAPVDHFLTSGWWPREDWGVWSKGRSQLSLSIPTDQAGRQVMLALTLRAHIPEGTEPPSVDIVVNGFYLGTHMLKRVVQTLKLRLPPACTASADMVIQLDCDGDLPDPEIAIGIEERPLRVGLVMMELL